MLELVAYKMAAKASFFITIHSSSLGFVMMQQKRRRRRLDLVCVCVCVCWFGWFGE